MKAHEILGIKENADQQALDNALLVYGIKSFLNSLASTTEKYPLPEKEDFVKAFLELDRSGRFTATEADRLKYKLDPRVESESLDQMVSGWKAESHLNRITHEHFWGSELSAHEDKFKSFAPKRHAFEMLEAGENSTQQEIEQAYVKKANALIIELGNVVQFNKENGLPPGTGVLFRNLEMSNLDNAFTTLNNDVLKKQLIENTFAPINVDNLFKKQKPMDDGSWEKLIAESEKSHELLSEAQKSVARDRFRELIMEDPDIAKSVREGEKSRKEYQDRQDRKESYEPYRDIFLKAAQDLDEATLKKPFTQLHENMFYFLAEKNVLELEGKNISVSGPKEAIEIMNNITADRQKALKAFDAVYDKFVDFLLDNTPEQKKDNVYEAEPRVKSSVFRNSIIEGAQNVDEMLSRVETLGIKYAAVTEYQKEMARHHGLHYDKEQPDVTIGLASALDKPVDKLKEETAERKKHNDTYAEYKANFEDVKKFGGDEELMKGYQKALIHLSIIRDSDDYGHGSMNRIGKEFPTSAEGVKNMHKEIRDYEIDKWGISTTVEFIGTTAEQLPPDKEIRKE